MSFATLCTSPISPAAMYMLHMLHMLQMLHITKVGSSNTKNKLDAKGSRAGSVVGLPGSASVPFFLPCNYILKFRLEAIMIRMKFAQHPQQFRKLLQLQHDYAVSDLSAV